MARKYGKRGKFKLKLKKNTIYSILAFGQILIGIFLFLSFTKQGESFVIINDYLKVYFGNFSFLVPLLFIFFGFLFLKLKFVLSRPNTSVGFFIFLISIVSMFKSGVIGVYIFATVASVLTGIGAFFVFLAGLFIGLVVFFDTSIDELIKGAVAIKNNIRRFLPSFVVSFFKQKNSFDNRQMTIKGDLGKYPNVSNKEPAIIANTPKKDGALISEKLVSNTLSSGLIWEYPPFSILSETEGQKADRGDVKKIATIIEKT